VLDDEIGSDRARRHARTAARIIEGEMVKPSLESHEVLLGPSGCGIKPITLRPWLSTPAIIAHRPVGIQVAEGDAVLRLELVQGALVGDVAALAVGNGKAEDFALVGAEVKASGWSGCADGRRGKRIGDRVANERAREQAALDQDLEPVAHAEHEAAIARRNWRTAFITGENLAMAPQRR